MNIIYHHRTQGRGVERVHILGVVNALRKLGHTVDILSVPGADLKEVEGTNVSIVRNKSIFGIISSRLHGVIFELIEIAYNLIILFRIPFYLRQKKYQFIYERYSLFMFSTVLICKVVGKPIILEINDSVLVPRVRKCYLKLIARIIEKWTFKNATGLVIISTVFRDIIESSYGKVANYVISPNAVDLDDFPDIDQALIYQLRNELGIKNNDIVCGYIGAFHSWHGVDWFVDILLRKINSEGNLKILMVGDGPLFPVIRDKLIECKMTSHLILAGRVSHKDINKYLSIMDYAVMPDSNIYGSPMKIFEYMAKHLGVVAPSYGPISEVVTDNKTGWLTPINGHEELIDKILSVSGNKDYLLKIGDNAFNYIKNCRQWKNNAEQIFDLLNNSGD